MKIHPLRTYCRILPLFLLAFLLIALTGTSRADISLSLSLDQFGSATEGNLSYAIFPGLSTTDTPITYYEVYSPNTNSYTGVGTGSSFNVFSLPNFDALANELTNGSWTLAESGRSVATNLHFSNHVERFHQQRGLSQPPDY